MKVEIKEWKDLSDSRELLESKTSPVGLIFMYLVFFIIFGALIWSYFGEIDEPVNAQGVVRPEENISTVTNKVLGRVETVNYQQGDKVQKDDTLYVIRHEEQVIQQDAVKSELNQAKEQLELLVKFRQSVVQAENLFDSNQDAHQDYYERYLQYQAQQQLLEQDILQTKTERELLLSENRFYQHAFNEEHQNTTTKLEGIELLKQAIATQQNIFTDNKDLYFQKYREYLFNVQKLEQNIEQRSRNYETSQILADAVPRRQIIEDKELMELAILELDKFENEYLLNLNQQQEQLEERLRTIEKNELQTVRPLDSITSLIASKEITLEKLKVDTLVQINEWIKQEERTKENLEERFRTLTLRIGDSLVKAPIDGIVNTTKDINEGDLLQLGVEVLTIIPENNDVYKVQLAVLNKDIATINEGDTVSYRFPALPYREYGELTGEISRISVDAQVSPIDGSRYYTVEASIETKPVYSYRGEQAYIKVGMETEASIVTGSKKILYHLLEKINLRD